VERGYQPRLIALSIVPNYLPERLYGVPYSKNKEQLNILQTVVPFEPRLRA
jgi:hypothetical protein